MKTMTCRELGGECDAKLSADTWSEMVRVMTGNGRDGKGPTSHSERHGQVWSLLRGIVMIEVKWRNRMSTLTTKTRKSLPKKDFALPGGKYPVEDKSHAANAKARATQQYNAGKLSAADRSKVDEKADAVLGSENKS